MSGIVPPDLHQPFQYWLRFEWGSNGNPHAHGQAYAANNPKFENITTDEDTKKQLIETGYPEARNMLTKDRAESALGHYFAPYVK